MLLFLRFRNSIEKQHSCHFVAQAGWGGGTFSGRHYIILRYSFVANDHTYRKHDSIEKS